MIQNRAWSPNFGMALKRSKRRKPQSLAFKRKKKKNFGVAKKLWSKGLKSWLWKEKGVAFEIERTVWTLKHYCEKTCLGHGGVSPLLKAPFPPFHLSLSLISIIDSSFCFSIFLFSFPLIYIFLLLSKFVYSFWIVIMGLWSLF